MGGDTLEKRAGDDALSVVVHDLAAARRAACATLGPDLPDLTYSWDFDGNGEDATEADHTHTYASAGSYEARVTVSNARGGRPVSDAVDVEVSAANQPPDTRISAGPTSATKHRSASFWFLSTKPEVGAGFRCSLDVAAFEECSGPRGYEDLPSRTHTFEVRAGAADASPASRTWTVDAVRPAVTGSDPKAGSPTRDRTPPIQALARDTQTDLSRASLTLYLDNRSINAISYDRKRNVLRYVPGGPLSYGRHTARVAATDAAGNTATATWTFKVIKG